MWDISTSKSFTLAINPGTQGSFSPARALRARIAFSNRLQSFNALSPVALPPACPMAVCKHVFKTWWCLSKSHIQKLRMDSKILPFRLNNAPFFRRPIRTCAITICAKPLSKHSRLMGRQLSTKMSCVHDVLKIENRMPALLLNERSGAGDHQSVKSLLILPLSAPH